MISEQSQAHKTYTSMWTNAWSKRADSPPTLLFIPFPVPPHWQSIWDKYLPPYSSMLVVLTYPKSTYVFDYLQHLSTTLFLLSTTPLSMFYHNLQHLQQKLTTMKMMNTLLKSIIDFNCFYVYFVISKNYNLFLKIRESIGTPISKVGVTWECEGSFTHNSPTLPRT